MSPFVLLHNVAPKAEFRRGKSDDTFNTNDDDGDDCSLVGAEMNLDVVDHDGDGNQSRRNSLPAMRASAEFANLHDLTTRSGEPDENEGGGDAENAKATSKEHERKWWWQKPSAEEAEEQARATVHNDDSDNCAGARHGEDGEETTRDAEVVSRRRSLDHQPIMRRASIGGMFGLGLGLGPQQAHKEEEPEVDAEQAWANATWGDDSTRRASADNAMDKAAERLDQHQPPQQPAPEPRARRATMSFGIMGELPSQRGTYDTNPTQSQPQNNRRSSLGFGPTSLLRGISGAGSSEPNEPSSEELEQKRRAMELEDQSLSDMLAMLKAQHNSGRAGTANKTCTNVANAVIVKEYMEVQRRASMSFTDAANSSSATSGTGAAGSDANLGGNDSRRQAMPKRTSMGFNILGGFGRNNQEQNEEEKEQSHYEDSYSTMTELKPVRPVPARSNSLRQMTARSSSLTGDGGFQGNTAEGIPSSRPPRTARRSSMH